MKTKKFNHNEIEKCRISKKEIDTEKENYSIILDCNSDSISSIGFYKAEVLKDLIEGKGKEAQKTFIQGYKEQVNKLLSSFQMPEKKEVYEINQGYV